MIFLLSGLALDAEQIRAGFSDYTGTLLALVIIFIFAPLTALGFSLLPLSTGILVGLFLVASMPSTLSSGVVMSVAAGGNPAHALLITIVANTLAVVTIPVSLSLLLMVLGTSKPIEIDYLPIMIKIAGLVVTPLIIGIVIRNSATSLVRPLLPYTSILNQIGILAVVWMATAQGRAEIVSSFVSVLPIIALVFCYHLSLMLIGLAVNRMAGIGKGRRESVILMGGQKTLPLSLILQVSLFPEYGLAIVVCVLHHITHLAMDGFLVQYLKKEP
jgi:sodium/bile acid cotransporter 7